MTAASVDWPAIPDQRLELVLVCAHPFGGGQRPYAADAAGVHGCRRGAIAAAFAVEPAAMAQRLVRVKRRIRDRGVPFTLPERDDLADRLPAVLEAVHTVYAIEWRRCPSDDPGDSLAAEAIHLTALLAELLPTDSEVLGLAALVYLGEARRPAPPGVGSRVRSSASTIRSVRAGTTS